MARMAFGEPAAPELGHTAYRRLREDIASGLFHPNERLVEAAVATRLGVGRTAVRAALVRLDQEGLVTLEPNRGARVRLISDREALEIEEVRATLEAMLARLVARFHQRIWAAADHATATRLVGSLKSQSIRLQYQTILRPGRTGRSLREHEAIFDALKAHDPDAAEEAMRVHLAEVQETLRWAIDGLRRAPSWLPG